MVWPRDFLTLGSSAGTGTVGPGLSRSTSLELGGGCRLTPEIGWSSPRQKMLGLGCSGKME